MKNVEEGKKKEVTEDKEDITDITEGKKRSGTLSRIINWKRKKVEKEAKRDGAEDKADTEEKTDEDFPKKEGTFTRMLSIFKKKSCQNMSSMLVSYERFSQRFLESKTLENYRQ